MKVLSLFDGISCGQVALNRAGFDIERYVAYEVDKYAVQITQKNFPNTEQMGDVFEGDFTQYKGFDLLIGGSPCTFWSVAQRSSKREVTPDGIGGQLFMQYVRALKESEVPYFLYENNYNINPAIMDFITEQLGVEPIMINSALVSGQSRKRNYWTNIPNVTQPEDKGIILKDLLEEGGIPFHTINGKSHTIPASYYKIGECPFSSFGSERGRQRVAVKVGELNDKIVYYDGKTNQSFIPTGNTKGKVGILGTDAQGNRIYSVEGKSVTITANGGGKGAKTGLYLLDLPDGNYITRKLTPVECERLQTLPDHYTAGVSNTQRYKGIGNGWTVDVIVHILGGLK